DAERTRQLGTAPGRALSPSAWFEGSQARGIAGESQPQTAEGLRRMAGSMTRLPKSFRLDRPVHAVFGSIYEVRTEEPIVHLTYDDGPHPDVTPAVLDVLDEFGIEATFFMLTRQAERHPDLVGEVRRLGHAIALHTRTHRPLPELGWRQLIDEVITARKDLEAIAGVPVRWFRPPYGADGWRGVPITRVGKMTSVAWTADTHDGKGSPARIRCGTPARTCGRAPSS